jgi:hypothetical protein
MQLCKNYFFTSFDCEIFKVSAEDKSVRLSRRNDVPQSPISRSNSRTSVNSRGARKNSGRVMNACRKVFPCLPEYKEMNIIDSLRLSPFQKFTRFGRIPYKFIINVLLLIFTSIQVKRN